MPELPEVETVRRGLEPVLLGRVLTRVEQRRTALRVPLPERFAARLSGRRVVAGDRRAKYLLVYLDDGQVWLSHLGMSGCFRIGPAADTASADVHDHVLVQTDGGLSIRYHDPRRFGFMDLVPAPALDGDPRLARLGPEPLAAAFTGAYLSERLRGRSAPLKTALMDQWVVAGMGNIYASESLFRARLAPTRPAASVSGRRASRLVTAIRAVFSEAIAAGGSSLRDHRHPCGELGCFQHQFAVYDRLGEACPGCHCDRSRGGGIRRLVLSGRSTFHCPFRQR